jgi:hypothetical protein
MKSSLLVTLCCLLAACSNQIGSDGSADLGSLSGDVTYHDRQDGMVTTNGESLSLYNKIYLKADGSQFNYQSIKIVNGVPTKCEMTGSWDVEGGDTTASGENELVATVTGGTVSAQTVRFPLRQLDYTTLRLQLTLNDSSVTDLTNQDFASYQEPDLTSAPTSTDCSWL